MIEERTRCIYTTLDNGIHEFVFTESSREAVDELAGYISTILETTPVDAPTTCYLIDNSQVDAVPLKHLSSRIKELNANRPEGREPGRLAVIYAGFMGHIANSILAMSMRNRFRFFQPAERDTAMDWLLERD